MDIKVINKLIKKTKEPIEYTSYYVKLKTTIASGFGECFIITPSHSTNKRFRDKFPDAESMYGSVYRIKNTKEQVAEARKLGCSVYRDIKPRVILQKIEYSDEIWKKIMETVKLHNVKYTFSEIYLQEMIQEVKQSYSDEVVMVNEEKKIVIVGNYHFHFSEYEPIKVINMCDESFHEDILTKQSLFKSIAIALNKF